MPVLRSVGLRYGGAVSAPAGNGPDGTQNYVELTVQASQVGSTLTDFPVYVDLSDLPAAFWSNVQADGGDIRVTESDGSTRCPVELVAIDTGVSTGELHFLASSLSSSSDTVYRIYYNATSTLSQPAVTDTYGRNAVWADYGGVWHMEEDPASDSAATDATGNGNTATFQATPTSATGKIGNGIESGDGFDRAEAADDATLDASTALTVQVWNKPTSTGNHWLLAKDDTSDRAYQWNYNAGATPSGMRFFLSDGATSQNVTAGTHTTGVWALYHGVYDGTDQIAYKDGSQVNSSPFTGPINNAAVGFAIGALSGGFSTVGAAGVTDEVRVRLEALSADWIAAEHTNQATPTTFYTIGTEQTA